MKLLVLDNYDSFTYNLVHLFRDILETEIDVFRNDQIALDAVAAYSHIVLSPGPGVPKDAGIMPQLIKTYGPDKKILGVCLGHQAIAEAFGAELYNLPQVLHGTSGYLQYKATADIFEGLPQAVKIGHYHSWVVKQEHFPNDLEVLATDSHGHIAAIRHREYNTTGLQFHPESVLTEGGERMLRNWLRY
jgi:anthranilate synthase component 2